MKKRTIYFFCSIILLLLSCTPATAQDNESLADSTYKHGMHYFNTGDIQTAIPYFEKVIALRAHTDSSRLINAFANLSRCYGDNGKKDLAWNTCQTALRLAFKFGKEKSLGFIFNNMGILQEDMGNDEKAVEYFQKGLEYSQKTQTWVSEGLCNESLGIVYGKQKKFDLAEDHLSAAFEIYEKNGEINLAVYTLQNLGELARQQNKTVAAIDWLEKAKTMALGAQNYAILIEASNSLSKINLDRKHNKEALDILVPLSVYVDSLEYLPAKEAYYHTLSNAYSANGLWQNAYAADTMFHLIRDSIFSNEQRTALNDLQTKYEVAEKDRALSVQQATIEKQQLIGCGLILILLITGFGAWAWRRAFRHKSKLNHLIKNEKKRSDELLLNILPASVAEELKRNNKVEARRFENTTVICTDFQDFTGIAGRLSPEHLVKLLDEYFQGFDTITTQYRVEKIKTMGDAYMCAGGLPDPSNGSPAETLRTAIAMRDMVIGLRQQKIAEGQPYFNCRIGVHTGPVVAGIVGSKKFVYDIWGDTVNTATRMEQYGAVDKVNVSETTQKLVADDPEFQFEFRGMLEVKGKGQMEMFFV